MYHNMEDCAVAILSSLKMTSVRSKNGGSRYVKKSPELKAREKVADWIRSTIDDTWGRSGANKKIKASGMAVFRLGRLPSHYKDADGNMWLELGVISEAEANDKLAEILAEVESGAEDTFCMQVVDSCKAQAAKRRAMPSPAKTKK
jgi:hypothetical protein